MSTLEMPTLAAPQTCDEGLPPLEPGDRLDQPSFHERYLAMPSNTRAELVGGTVYISSPAKRRHGRHHFRLTHWLANYESETDGVEGSSDTTTILGDEDEVQPDAYLLIVPEKGGQSRVTSDDFVGGAPEFVAEIANSTESYDLHAKKTSYERAGVREYLVVALRQRKVFWFISRAGRFGPLQPGPDGVFRSGTFPGLWLDPTALLSLDRKQLLTVLRQGMAGPEYVAFAERLRSP